MNVSQSVKERVGVGVGGYLGHFSSRWFRRNVWGVDSGLRASVVQDYIPRNEGLARSVGCNHDDRRVVVRVTRYPPRHHLVLAALTAKTTCT